MVVSQLAVVWANGLMANENAHQLVDQLDGPTRARLLAALAALILLGLALVVFVSLSGRAVKRYMNSGTRETRPTFDRDDWALKPLIEKEKRRNPSEPPETDGDS